MTNIRYDWQYWHCWACKLCIWGCGIFNIAGLCVPKQKKGIEPNVAGSRGGSLSQMPTRSMTSFIFSPLLSWQKSAKRWRWIWWGLARLKMENVGWQLIHAITSAKSLPKNLEYVVHEWTIIIKGHGPQTGRCVPNGKPKSFGNTTVCEIQSWWEEFLNENFTLVRWNYIFQKNCNWIG